MHNITSMLAGERVSRCSGGGSRGLSAGDRPPRPANDPATEIGTYADAAEIGTHARAAVVEVCTGVLVGLVPVAHFAA